MAFTQVFPILTTTDLQRLVDFYVSGVDGVVAYAFAPEGEAVFVSLDLAGGHLGIGYAPDAPAPDARQRASLWLYADDCDAAVERLRTGGATVVEEPTDMAWGERVATVTDPDGNVLHVGQRPVSG